MLYINDDGFVVSEINQSHIDIVYKRRPLHHSRNKSISRQALRHYISRGEGKRVEGRVRRLLSKHRHDRSGLSRRKRTCSLGEEDRHKKECLLIGLTKPILVHQGMGTNKPKHAQNTTSMSIMPRNVTSIIFEARDTKPHHIQRNHELP